MKNKSLTLFLACLLCSSISDAQPREGSREFFNRRAGAVSPLDNPLLERVAPVAQYVYHEIRTQYIINTDRRKRQDRRNNVYQTKSNELQRSGLFYAVSGMGIGGLFYLLSLYIKK
ncbi:hypothetical protein EKK58_06655 [Candidatus Dependentiae bacterium]|nr:MAG: hypothetical protein EKK58_06655 [Candidatus Dependentiae bacterium]